MTEKCAVYSLGDLGGPFKIGCSNSPKRRIGQIRNSPPGSGFMSKKAIVWYEHWFDVRELAATSEKRAHEFLDKFRVDRSLEMESWQLPLGAQPEWFFCSLAQTIEAIEQAAAIAFTHKQLTEVLNPEDLRDDQR